MKQNLILVLLIIFLSTPTLYAGIDLRLIASDTIQTGPYIDAIVYKVITSQDERALRLLSGEIEIVAPFIHITLIPSLEPESLVFGVYACYRNGYGHLTFNCDKYPLNISGLRRAIAFAFDKERVVAHYLDGLGITHDSVVPRSNVWCAENDFDYHYYNAQPDIGNVILDELNFTIDSETGYRLAPDGTQFDILIEIPSGCGGPTSKVVLFDALESLHINYSSSFIYDWDEFMERINSHGDYDIYHSSTDFQSNRIDWLAYEYWSENANEYGENPSNFRNATYDSWRTQLLQGASYGEIYNACLEMQKILQYNVPRLIVYENTYFQAYRNDGFTGHIPDLMRHISGLWTMRKIHNIDGSLGGIVNVAIDQDPESLNIAFANSTIAELIQEELYSALYHYGPDLAPVPDLAKSMMVETHIDNPEVSSGHKRYTIEIIQNATWSDGEPLTADDVAFTLNYLQQLAAEEDLIEQTWDLSDIFAVYSPSPFVVIVEFSTERYWNFDNFAYLKILPKHIYTSPVCLETPLSQWNPGFNQSHPLVTSGPFILSDFEVGEYYELTRNPEFYYRFESITTTETTTTTSRTQADYGILSIVLASSSFVTIVIVSVEALRRRNRKS